MSRLIDLTGKKFGRLIIIKRMDSDKWGQPRWLCSCSCGKEKIIYGSSLKGGDTKSCGCLRKELMTKHGHNNREKTSKTYKSWENITQRCTNPNVHNYNDYGGRGIKVCKRWLNSFVDFLEDMGEMPKGYQIDRINNNEGYFKLNCRWSTRKQQQRNRRNNLYFTYKNKTQLLIEWAEEFNINYKTLHSRIFKYGWSIEKALTTPVKKY